MKKQFGMRSFTVFATYMALAYGCLRDKEVPIVSTTKVTAVETTTAATGGVVSSDGGSDVTARGVCWSTVQGPTTEDKKTTNGAGTGSFITTITGLTENTTYFVRAYATNSIGTSYGEEISFITNYIVVNLTVPVLKTTIVTSIGPTSAVSGGIITSDGGDTITARGMCWGNKVNPTIGDFITIDNAGKGSFTSNLMDLTPGKTYFTRAYATNKVGTAYGTQFSFSTPGSADGTGLQKSNFPGGPRYSAAGFSVGSKVYMGLGFNDPKSLIPIRDFWEWDQATNLWTKKADYPGNSGASLVCFSIGNKGYIGTGYTFNSNRYTNEFWEYDPAKDTWTQKVSLPGTPARAWAVGFSIGNKGYIGTGAIEGSVNNSKYNDFWEWDQATNTWTKKADFGGDPRGGAVGFSIGNKGYIGTGSDGNTTLFNDFWEWDQATNVWTRKADFAGTPRSGAIGFSIGNKGYIGTGIDLNITNKDFWEWNQQTNTWRISAEFDGGPRAAALGVTIGNKAYIGIGTLNYPGSDFWEYNP